MDGQAVRGADGTGWEGDVSPLKHLRLGGSSGGTPGSSEDVRSTWQGQLSAYRSLSGILKNYGPWLTTLESADNVAIIVSKRMVRLDWYDTHLAGIYFQHLYEAYNALLYAHRPASFVFIEDIKPEELRKYKALLVVGQLVDHSATHSHKFASPLIGSKFRIYGDKYPAHIPGMERAGVDGIGWPVGNIRLGELGLPCTVVPPATPVSPGN